MDTIKLDIKERLQLSFQLKILEKLYPEEEEYYANHRKAIEDGYELHYSWIAENISEGLSTEECKEVLDILDMYMAMYISFLALKNPQKLSIDSIIFPGFDGNNETMRMLYTKYIIEELNRFEEIQKLTKGEYNSHTEMIPTYKNMLEKWNQFPFEESHSLNEEQLLDLINTRGY
jgi:hypothetical protein